nr:hypothetical protein [Micromonospora sp. KC723]
MAEPDELDVVPASGGVAAAVLDVSLSISRPAATADPTRNTGP